MARFPVLLDLLRCWPIMEIARFSPRTGHTVSSWRRPENADAPDGRSPVDWTFVFQKATDRYTIDSGMTHAKKALVDGALILLGAGITILFVSTDGNGQ